jgi:hypothetical protein
VKRFLALLPVLAALAVVGGGIAADSGPLPGPVQTDPYAQTGAPLLQVTPMPWGAGWVQSKPYLIDCPLSCIRPADKDSSLVLTATPSAGYTFVGWQVADHGAAPTAGACPGTGPCTVTMSGAKDVVALFDGPTPQPVGTPPSKPKEQPPPE